jgi:hypothetical protein
VAQRGSTHHSGRVDDVLADEVEPLVRSGHESRAAEDRLHEPEADDEPVPDSRIAGNDGPPLPSLLDLDEIEARSRLATSLRPGAFPADREQLGAVAADEHAPPEVVEALHTLPAGIRFVNVQQVWEALGGERERRGVAAATTPPAGTEAPVDVEIEVELELEGARRAAAVDEGALPGHEVPWWTWPLETGLSLATLPLRVSYRVVRALAERVRR